MGIPKNSRRRGGPRSAAGRQAVARNALKHGVAAARWWDPEEQAQYEAMLGELRAQYPQLNVTQQVLVERLATNSVKLARLESIDNAQHALARLQAEAVNAQLAAPVAAAAEAGADPALAGPAPALLALRQATALPALERMDKVERYRMNLERQIITLVREIRLSGVSAQAQGDGGSGRRAAKPTEVEDATIVVPPGSTTH